MSRLTESGFSTSRKSELHTRKKGGLLAALLLVFETFENTAIDNPDAAILALDRPELQQ